MDRHLGYFQSLAIIAVCQPDLSSFPWIHQEKKFLLDQTKKKEQNKNNFEICIPNSPPRRLSRETSRGHFQFCAREWVDVGRSLWTLSSLPTLMAQIKPHELFLFLEWPDCFLPRPPDPHVPGPLTAYSFSFPFPSSLSSEGYPKPFQPHRWGLF